MLGLFASHVTNFLNCVNAYPPLGLNDCFELHCNILQLTWNLDLFNVRIVQLRHRSHPTCRR
jgi:hypothetical protein